MTKKIGNFFLIVGFVLLIVFLAAPNKTALFGTFCFGSVVFLILAFALRQMGKEEKPPSGRFRLLRKLLGKDE